jgi:hypothetical protein
MNVIINDLPLTIPFRVYDISKGQYIFSILRPDDGGDVPPDIALLPVVGIRSVDNVLYIDTCT